MTVIRPTKKKGIKVNYISKTIFSEKLLENKKTESGYLKISSPALTAADLIQFEKRIGGITRASTVINELTEVIRKEEFNEIFLKEVPTTTIQRLGYILEYVVNRTDLSLDLFKICRENNLKFYRIPLKVSDLIKGFPTDKKWQVIKNIEIEIDE
ncbi:MAG: type IV toxin-antitoxin system AbiEi family antitoxin [Bacteroidales bacterium]|nr:type IV toxin-antitoxin system AbiEi family antitoxin [Bacteroidales bacterium]